jgi:hypothetical protein
MLARVPGCQGARVPGIINIKVPDTSWAQLAELPIPNPPMN